ncbi:hypothetical protein Naga_100880g1 [Nannochloropsis gaditana]|uniref:Uncharacterized protein n=1 Tax=Nannochloropsis gaditana TaxID=72520 RepID=W7TGU3_9STRA|nr:hypothetical protein Naga_100880g1 [Nannochloropsis gaditana]
MECLGTEPTCARTTRACRRSMPRARSSTCCRHLCLSFRRPALCENWFPRWAGRWKPLGPLPVFNTHQSKSIKINNLNYIMREREKFSS